MHDSRLLPHDQPTRQFRVQRVVILKPDIAPLACVADEQLQ